jgi:hypothetical protein
LQLARGLRVDGHLKLRFAAIPIRNIKHSGQLAGAETPSSP